MELEQDTPEAVEVEPEALPESDHGGEAEVADSAPSSEPRSSTRHDDGVAERLRASETQARFFQEEAERTRRELEALRSAQRPDPREEQARLEAMDPEQRVLYHFDKQAQEFRSSAFVSEVRTAAQIDRLKFENDLAKTAANLGWSVSKLDQLDREVEQWYNDIAAQAMRSGQPLLVKRVDLLDKKIGQEMRTTGTKAVKAATAAGKANVARQSAKMTPASSNVTGKSTGKSKAQESMERMLEAGVLEM